jgi:hypothetical protein
MSQESVVVDRNRPYPPASNVVMVLQRLRSRNVPDRVDADYLRDAGVADSLVHRVLFALKFLGLVQDDLPTSSLRSLSTSTDEEYQDILTRALHEAYAEVFAVVDPSQDAEDRIMNVFRRYTPASQRDRMVRFFLGMCREAGIPTLDNSEQSSSSSKLKSSHGRSGQPKTAKSSSKSQPDTGEAENVNGAKTPAALELLVRSLPPEGQAMDANQRRRWLALAEATLAFLYPEPANVGGSAHEPEEVRGD